MKGTIGIFIPTMHRTGRHRYIRYLSDELASAGYKTFCFSSYSDLFWHDVSKKGESRVYDLYRRIELSGVVLYSELIKDNELCSSIISECEKRNIPAFTVERPIDGAYNIIYDHGKSFGKIVDHIIEKHGARNIFMMSGMRGNSFSLERNQAYRDSLEKHGIEYDETKIYYGDFWDLPTRSATAQMFSEHKALPDAIVCANDVMAITVCLVLSERGIRVPEDIIVTGFDGTERAKAFFPTIASSVPDYKSSCRYICNVLESYHEAEHKHPGNMHFEGIFIEGQSCGCDDIKKQLTGVLFAELYEQSISQKLFRYENDNLMLSNIGNGDVRKLFANMENTLRTLAPDGIEIYLDPHYFDASVNDGGFVLAASVIAKQQRFSVSFSPIRHGEICSQALSGTDQPVIFLPLFAAEKNYGYLAAPFDPDDLLRIEKLYDLVIHLNILLSSCETTIELNFQYEHDHLTGLLNRYGFYRRAGELISDAAEKGLDIIIVSADMNGLKYINDTFGHKEGDYAITSAAKIIEKVIGRQGICARFGGDEYLAVVVSMTEDEFIRSAGSEIEHINCISGKPYGISFSIGVESSSACDAMDNLEEIINAADKKMFMFKAQSPHKRRD